MDKYLSEFDKAWITSQAKAAHIRTPESKVQRKITHTPRNPHVKASNQKRRMLAGEWEGK